MTVDDVARRIVRMQPYLPGVGWFVVTFFGVPAALSALSGWWPGVGIFVALGAVGRLAVWRMQVGARELERMVAPPGDGGVL